MCHTKTVQAAMKKRRTHRSNRLSDSMPLYRPCNLSSSIVQSAKKEKSRGVFKEHELYSNSYGLKGRPHQLHPLLGCHRALEKRRWFLHLLSTESLFPPIVPPPLPSPVPFTFVEPEGWCLKVAWSYEKMKIVWQRRIGTECFFSFNFHLHLFNIISEKIGCLSKHLCTYPSPDSTLTLTCYRLTVFGLGEE